MVSLESGVWRKAMKIFRAFFVVFLFLLNNYLQECCCVSFFCIAKRFYRPNFSTKRVIVFTTKFIDEAKN